MEYPINSSCTMTISAESMPGMIASKSCFSTFKRELWQEQHPEGQEQPSLDSRRTGVAG